MKADTFKDRLERAYGDFIFASVSSGILPIPHDAAVWAASFALACAIEEAEKPVAVEGGVTVKSFDSLEIADRLKGMRESL